MIGHDATTALRFRVHGDGSHRGDDGCAGELASMTLYVARALDQVDQILGVGELAAFRATEGPRELHAEVGHEGDFGLEVVGRLSRTDLELREPEEYWLTNVPGDELDMLLDEVTAVDLVAGCFVVSANGNLLAHRVPGVGADALSGTGRRVKVAHDAFGRLLGTTTIVADFTWAQVVAAPVGNGLAMVLADPLCPAETVLAAVQVGGEALIGLDLAAFRAGAFRV